MGILPSIYLTTVSEDYFLNYEGIKIFKLPIYETLLNIGNWDKEKSIKSIENLIKQVEKINNNFSELVDAIIENKNINSKAIEKLKKIKKVFEYYFNGLKKVIDNNAFYYELKREFPLFGIMSQDRKKVYYYIPSLFRKDKISEFDKYIEKIENNPLRIEEFIKFIEKNLKPTEENLNEHLILGYIDLEKDKVYIQKKNFYDILEKFIQSEGELGIEENLVNKNDLSIEGLKTFIEDIYKSLLNKKLKVGINVKYLFDTYSMSFFDEELNKINKGIFERNGNPINGILGIFIDNIISMYPIPIKYLKYFNHKEILKKIRSLSQKLLRNDKIMKAVKEFDIGFNRNKRDIEELIFTLDALMNTIKEELFNNQEYLKEFGEVFQYFPKVIVETVVDPKLKNVEITDNFNPKSNTYIIQFKFPNAFFDVEKLNLITKDNPKPLKLVQTELSFKLNNKNGNIVDISLGINVKFDRKYIEGIINALQNVNSHNDLLNLISNRTKEGIMENLKNLETSINILKGNTMLSSLIVSKNAKNIQKNYSSDFGLMFEIFDTINIIPEFSFLFHILPQTNQNFTDIEEKKYKDLNIFYINFYNAFVLNDNSKNMPIYEKYANIIKKLGSLHSLGLFLFGKDNIKSDKNYVKQFLFYIAPIHIEKYELHQLGNIGNMLINIGKICLGKEVFTIDKKTSLSQLSDTTNLDKDFKNLIFNIFSVIFNDTNEQSQSVSNNILNKQLFFKNLMFKKLNVSNFDC